jgi:hypothetical protein
LAIQSAEALIQFMELFRRVYRNSFVEVLLLACVAFQIGSGVSVGRDGYGK